MNHDSVVMERNEQHQKVLAACSVLQVKSSNSLGFPGGSVVKNAPGSTGDAGDTGLIPESGRCPGGGNGNPPQYSCHGQRNNPTDRGARGGYSPWGHKELDKNEWPNTYPLRSSSAGAGARGQKRWIV